MDDRFLSQRSMKARRRLAQPPSVPPVPRQQRVISNFYHHNNAEEHEQYNEGGYYPADQYYYTEEASSFYHHGGDQRHEDESFYGDRKQIPHQYHSWSSGNAGYGDLYSVEAEDEIFDGGNNNERASSDHGEGTDPFSLTRHNRYDEIEGLLDAGLPVEARDQYGNIILIVACQNGLKRIAKLALRRGADINAQNAYGNTPLHFCYMYNHGSTLGAYLISKGANPLIPNYEGRLCHQVFDNY